MKKIIILLLLVVISAVSVEAAVIQGTIYDFSLKKIANSIIEIDTQPVQRQITQDGRYSFSVPPGDYTITAKNREGTVLAREDLVVSEDGTYTIDLIAFIDIEEEQELLNDTDLDIESDLQTIEEKNSIGIIIAAIVMILAVLTIFLYYKYRKKQSRKVNLETDETDFADKVLEIIKKEGGRTTQKQIRKALPYSEAKISLVITELEKREKVEKIKKGRTNVIILKK